MTVFSPILGLVAEDSDHVRTQQMSCPSYHVAYFVTIFTTDTEDGHRSSVQQSKIQLSARLVSSWELRRICSMPLSQLLVVAGNSRNLLKSHNSYFCLHCHMFAPWVSASVSLPFLSGYQSYWVKGTSHSCMTSY